MRYFHGLLLGGVIALLFPLPTFAAQASLAISPKEGTYVVGNQFTVGVVLDTGGVSVNAVEGKIRYLPDDIAVVRIEKEKSPITSWVVEPDYLTEEGLISFGGVNPDGIEGKGKTLFLITFRVVRSGEARVRIASGAAILSEGGAGTNILTDLRGGTYKLSADEDRPEALRGGPSILRSSSHPDETAWYNSSDVSFEWSRSPDTDQIRFSVDQNSEGTPSNLFSGDVEGKNVSLESGVWYGHLSLHDDSGWSPIGHLKVQIDTERPATLRVNEIPRGDAKEPRPVISLEASDERSGISHYEISVDGKDPARYEDDGNHRYELPPLPPGEHVISVRVFDRASNSLADTIVVFVEGLPLPTLEPTPSVLSVGGEIDLEGKVGEGMSARVAIGFDGGEWRTEDVASGGEGSFIHTFVFPQEGVYRLKVQAIDQRGATSEWTPEILIRVEPRSFLGAIGSVGGGAGILMSLVFLAAGLFLGLWYGRVGSMREIPVPVSTGSIDRRDDWSVLSRVGILIRPVIGIGSSIQRVSQRLFARRSTDAATEPVKESPQLSRTTMSARGPMTATTPSHTLSLKRRDSTQPPHSPTVLGR